MAMTKVDTVLITGIDGPAGRGAALYFREKGFSVIGADIKGIDPPFGSFYIIPRAEDVSFPAALLEIVKKERPALFIPTMGEELLVVSKLKRVVEGYGCKVIISAPDAVEIANDKLKMVMVMAGHGIPVPITFDECTPRGKILEQLRLPLLSRPRFEGREREAVIYRTAEELLEEKGTGLIFQELLPGDGYDVNLFIGRRHEVKAAVVLRKLPIDKGIERHFPAVERVERVDIAWLGIKVALTLGLEGPVSIDIRLREDLTPVLLSINARVGDNIQWAREVLDALFLTLEKGGASWQIAEARNCEK